LPVTSSVCWKPAAGTSLIPYENPNAILHVGRHRPAPPANCASIIDVILCNPIFFLSESTDVTPSDDRRPSGQSEQRTFPVDLTELVNIRSGSDPDQGYSLSLDSRPACSRLTLRTRDLDARKTDYCVNWGDSAGTPNAGALWCNHGRPILHYGISWELCCWRAA
jgi:hypothetical protein